MPNLANAFLKTTPLLMSVSTAEECRARNDRQSYVAITRELVRAFELADMELSRRPGRTWRIGILRWDILHLPMAVDATRTRPRWWMLTRPIFLMGVDEAAVHAAESVVFAGVLATVTGHCTRQAQPSPENS